MARLSIESNKGGTWNSLSKSEMRAELITSNYGERDARTRLANGETLDMGGYQLRDKWGHEDKAAVAAPVNTSYSTHPRRCSCCGGLENTDSVWGAANVRFTTNAAGSICDDCI